MAKRHLAPPETASAAGPGLHHRPPVAASPELRRVADVTKDAGPVQG